MNATSKRIENGFKNGRRRYGEKEKSKREVNVFQDGGGEVGRREGAGGRVKAGEPSQARRQGDSQGNGQNNRGQNNRQDNCKGAGQTGEPNRREICNSKNRKRVIFSQAVGKQGVGKIDEGVRGE